MSPKLSPPPEQLRAYLGALCTGAGEGQFLDVRWRSPRAPMRRRFLPASQPEDAAALAMRLAPRNDVYVGVAMRDGDEHGGRTAISSCRLVWVESDDPSTLERLLEFAHAPTLTVASGTPGHLQLYWMLERPCASVELASANRRLARTLAGDLSCADPARILRFPGTLNHKHDPPQPVRLLAHRLTAHYTLAQLTAGLVADDDDPPDRVRPVSPRRTVRTILDRELLAIPAAEYAQRLTGRSANREGKLLCPFHDDADPSLQLYADGGFYCFGSDCRRGGTIFDFAGYLWGIPPRGVGFLELRLRLSREFALTADPSG